MSKTFSMSHYVTPEDLLKAKVKYLEARLEEALDVLEDSIIATTHDAAWEEASDRHPKLAEYYGWTEEEE